MFGFRYEIVPEDEKNEEEKLDLATRPALSCKERRERFWKTVFAACVFTVALAAALLALSLAIPDEPEVGLWSTRQALILQIPMETVVWRKNETFAGRESEEVNQAWDSLLPPGHGFILVSKSEAKKHNLPPGILVNETHDRYSISMYHQIHCLGMIRLGYSAAVGELGRSRRHNSSGQPKSDSGDHSVHMDFLHLAHCFDYLRQAILCAGDTTIEWAREAEEGDKTSQVDGWEIEHQCRSSDAIYDFTTKHRAENEALGIFNAGNNKNVT